MTKRKQYKREIEIKKTRGYWEIIAFNFIMTAWIFGLVVGRFAPWESIAIGHVIACLFLIWGMYEIRHEREIKFYLTEIKGEKNAIY